MPTKSTTMQLRHLRESRDRLQMKINSTAAALLRLAESEQDQANEQDPLGLSNRDRHTARAGAFLEAARLVQGAK